jgi:hypothetical protein
MCWFLFDDSERCRTFTESVRMRMFAATFTLTSRCGEQTNKSINNQKQNQKQKRLSSSTQETVLLSQMK